MAETLAHAWAQLQAGKINLGREELIRVCAREPENVDALALGVTEFYREPRRGECGELALRLNQVAPDSSEFYSFLMLRAATLGKVDHYTEPMKLSFQSRPRGPHGAALVLLGALAGSDFIIRALFGPVDNTAIATSALQGSLSFVLRQGDPISYFQRGANNPQAEAAAYEKHLGGFTPERRAEVTQLIIQRCAIGLGLAYRDIGRMDESRRAFASVSRDSSAITRADVIDILLA